MALRPGMKKVAIVVAEGHRARPTRLYQGAAGESTVFEDSMGPDYNLPKVHRTIIAHASSAWAEVAEKVCTSAHTSGMDEARVSRA